MRTDSPATWFRLYAEFATDPKVQMLSEIDQRRFLMLLCLRCSNGNVTLHEAEIAFQLRISDEDWKITKNVLYKKGLIDSDSKPIKWENRQFDSDTSNARVAKSRALQKEKLKKDSNVDVTLQKRKSNRIDTETETEIDTEKKKKNTSAIAPPDGVTDSVWQDFQAIRKAKKAALTQTAVNKIRSQAELAGVSLQSALETCCERGWASFNADWLHKNVPHHAPQIETFRERDTRIARERINAVCPSIAEKPARDRNVIDITPNTNFPALGEFA